jgi:branched-chain amino acid transport system ATP-binding protein
MEALRIIKDEHRNLWRIAITVDQVIDEMEADGKVDGAFLGSVFDYFEQFMDDCHHPKEDDYLFRLLRQRSRGRRPARPPAGRAPQRPGNLKPCATSSPAASGRLPVPTWPRPCALPRRPKSTSAARKEIFPSPRRPHRRRLGRDRHRLPRQRRPGLRHPGPGRIPRTVPPRGQPGAGIRRPRRPQRRRSAAGGDVLLKVEGLESSYGRIKALKGISIEVRRGEPWPWWAPTAPARPPSCAACRACSR